MRSVRRLARRLKGDEEGAAAIMFALTMPILAGIVALSVDIMFVFNQEEQLRTAAEAAATAAVSVLPNRDGVPGVAISYALRNVKGSGADKIVSADDIQIGYWNKAARTFAPADDDERANAVRVIASRTAEKGNALPTFFGKVFSVAAFDALEVAVIATRFDGYPCINVLAPDGVGLKANSNAKINVKDCAIHVHSAAGTGLSVEANADVIVTRSEICLKGGYQARSNSELSPTPDTNCDPAPDPFASVPEPPHQGCDENNFVYDKKKHGSSLKPGIYCGGITINSNANVEFLPGEYIIKNGSFIVNSNVEINGNGVAFYLTGNNALLNFNSNSKISLTAPSSGPLAGFIFFQDRNYGGQHILSSNTAAMLDGTIYLPKATLTSNSNSQMGGMSTCLMIIVYRLEFNSNSGVNTTPDYSQCSSPSNTRKSRIVS
jgi:hypothetical protein